MQKMQKIGGGHDFILVMETTIQSESSPHTPATRTLASLAARTPSMFVFSAMPSTPLG